MSSTRCNDCDKDFATTGAYYSHRQDTHTLQATVTRKDNGNEIVLTRDLNEPFICLCEKEYKSKNGFKTHVSNCPIVTNVQFKGISNESAITYSEALQRATSPNFTTAEEQKNNSRLAKVLNLQPIMLQDASGENYALLGNKDVVNCMTEKKRLSVSILDVEPKKKKKYAATGACEHADLDSVIANGPYSDILNSNDYAELDMEMACNLNKDWFMFKNQKFYCALLLAGAILLEGKKSILINTIEVYGRTSTVDPYHERFINGKAATLTTLPPQKDLTYKDVYVTLKKEDNSRKLIMATKSMNALITSSIRLDQEVKPEVGSSTLQFTPTNHTKIYILASQLEDAKKLLLSDNVQYLYPQDILSQLRQVRSKFVKTEGYMLLRASSPWTNYHNLKPYTVWTASNYDDTSIKPSSAKIGSTLFQIIARSVLNKEVVVRKSEVEELFDQCNSGKIKDFLRTVLAECFNVDNDLVLKENRVLEQCLQGIATELSSSINTMNKNTTDRILEIFKNEL